MKQIKLPNKKYQIIYVDPPWLYRDKALAGHRGGGGCKYPGQKKEWIENLNVNSIADINCTLFLWSTMPILSEAFDLIRAWGFRYKTVAFTWVKRTKRSGVWFWGMGSWTRANAELCLLATKGRPKRINAGIHSVIETVPEKHSKKPNEVRERIVQLMGNLPRIELFARLPKNIWFDASSYEGWDVWGDEV